jgi:phosphate transport system substrate-binding protein
MTAFRGGRIMRKVSKLITAVVALGLVAVACNSSSSSTNGSFNGAPITGAGSTFAEPIYTQWAHDFHGMESGAQVSYNAIGSGGGVESFTKQTVDFGASDAPLQQSQISALPANYIEIPTVLGGVAVAYNPPSGVPNGIKLDGTTIADIFLRKVTTWNDPEITNLNPGVNFPNSPISVVHRSDDSGTTFVFTSWLSQESPTWKKQIGANTTVQWPSGEAGKDGSDGVAGYMAATKGSVGYISYDFVVANKLSAAAVKAKDGAYIAPSVGSISKAGSQLSLPISPTTNVLNAPVTGAYPIATTTYVLIYTNQTNKDKAQTLVDFFAWGLKKGQSDDSALNYAPLPSTIASAALADLGKITVNGQAVKPSAGI